MFSFYLENGHGIILLLPDNKIFEIFYNPEKA